MDAVTVLALLFFATAVLYASVGQAGGSGYLAAMAFFGLASDVMKPTALLLNVLVATIAAIGFCRAGHFSWPTLWPFALGSVPFACLGGALHLPEHLFGPLVGTILLIGAAFLAWRPGGRGRRRDPGQRPVPVLPGLGLGAFIGLLSGLTATGGAIFLSPLLLFTGWGEPRRTAGVASVFIFVNSLAGLAGNYASVQSLPAGIVPWAVAAGAGGVVGSQLGSRVLPERVLRRVLAVILVIAGLKLVLS